MIESVVPSPGKGDAAILLQISTTEEIPSEFIKAFFIIIVSTSYHYQDTAIYWQKLQFFTPL